MSNGSQAPATPIAQAAPSLSKAARRLQQEADGHMRLANQHRQRAKTLHRELEELERNCAALGIRLVLDPTTTHAQGGTSGNRSND